MMCYQKRLFCKEHIFLDWFIIFLFGLPVIDCLSVCSSSIGLAVICHHSTAHVPLGNHMRILCVFSCSSYAWCYGRSGVWSPDLIVWSIKMVQDLNPWPLSMICLVGPGFDSRPNRLFQALTIFVLCQCQLNVADGWDITSPVEVR